MKNPNSHNNLLIFLFLFCLCVFAGCVAQSGRFTIQSTPTTPPITVTITQTPTKTIIPTESLAPIDTNTGTQGLVLKDLQKLLLNVTNTKVDLDTCYPEGSTQVWESVFPFKEKQILLASDPSNNYFAPTYSPDGQWIAYIESSPVIGILDLENPSIPNPSGNDSIWIMHQDGSEKHRISKLFDSFSVKDAHYCYPQSRIKPELKWSPDGKYIYFTDYQSTLDGYRLGYYILNVQTKESYLFNTSDWDTLYGFAWLSESGRFFYDDGNNYWTNQITSEGIDRSEAKPLPTNSSITNSSLDSGSGLIEPIIVSENDSSTKFALWQYDTNLNSWSEKIKYTGNYPRLGTFWGVFGDDADLYFIDLKNFRIIGPISSKNKVVNYVYLFPEVKNASENIIVSIMDSETNDIWGVDPYLNKEMYQLVDWDSMDPEKSYSIIDQYPSWSWSP
jgi:hypothetical protein